MLQINKTRLRRLWQALVIVICVTTVMVLFVYSNDLNNRNYKMLHDQTEDIARLFLRQMAVSAVSAMADEDTDTLDLLVNNLQEEPLILDATVYNAEGLMVANSSLAMPLDQLTG
ncbi:AhpA/YtjB family protein [Veronia nyctiphanis]|uniref:AhpA/YtjB family protein n=1 Tax=Veronia nyctiphanis TaxID=1278244 RepID=UPI0022A83B09|nr:AhpA/YtjB family protein [Veronia nyctiphanis]